jgi:hypothetical protein
MKQAFVTSALLATALAISSTSFASGQEQDKRTDKANQQGQSASAAQVPKGWRVRGSRPQDYEMGVTQTARHGGQASAFIKANPAPQPGFGTLMQDFKADAYRGKRVRLAGYVKTDNVEEWAGLWMRVDGEQGVTLSFDNMQDRHIKGVTDWQRYEIVLDVPTNSLLIAFGLMLSGKGQVWLDDLKLEEVDQKVPTTKPLPSDEDKKQMEEHRQQNQAEWERVRQLTIERLKTAPAQPVNLDFEQRG